MILHRNCCLILNGQRFRLFHIRNRLIKNYILEQMCLFLFNLHSIDLIDFQMQQVRFSHQRNHFRCVIITGNDNPLRNNPSLLRDKANKDLLTFLWMNIELNRVDHEVGELQKVTSLLCVILLIVAEESVASLAAFVGKSEDHVGSITEPAVLAFEF